MSDVKMMLGSQKEELDRCREILHRNKDEAAGQALSKVLRILTDKAMARLLTVTDPAEFRAIQSEALSYQRILDFQHKSPISPTKN